MPGFSTVLEGNKLSGGVSGTLGMSLVCVSCMRMGVSGGPGGPQEEDKEPPSSLHSPNLHVIIYDHDPSARLTGITSSVVLGGAPRLWSVIGRPHYFSQIELHK